MPGRPLPEPAVFVLADTALNYVASKIKDDQWLMTMPSNFQTRRTDHRPTLREIINYHAYADSWVPDILAGRTMDEVGKDKFAARVERACTAARELGDLDRVVHLSFGDFKAREYFWQMNMFRGLRAYEIGKVIGANFTMPNDLVQGIWDEITPHAEEWRKIGVFSAAVPIPHGAPLVDRLLGLTGRDPYAA